MREQVTEQRTASDKSTQHGVFIRGTYLGRQAARTFTRDGNGETVNVKPKIGLMVDGLEYAIKATDDAQIDAALQGKVKGDEVTLRIEALAPFGSNKPVDFTLPGVVASRNESWR